MHAASILPAAEDDASERLAVITAEAKLRAAPTPAEAAAWLDERERLAVLARPELAAVCRNERPRAAA